MNRSADLPEGLTDSLEASPACKTKGQLNPASDYPVGDQRVHFCTDYVASHRDNAGDLLLEILFDKDLRSTM